MVAVEDVVGVDTVVAVEVDEEVGEAVVIGVTGGLRTRMEVVGRASRRVCHLPCRLVDR